MSESIVTEEKVEIPVDEVQDKKQKRNARIAKRRGLKNFGIWLLGLFFGLILCLASIFLILKFMPIKTITNLVPGVNSEDVASDNVLEKSVLDFVLDISANPDKYGVSDLPIIVTLLENAVNGGGLDEIVTIDFNKLKELKFSYTDGTSFADELLACVRISPALFGDDLKELSVFKDSVIPSNDEIYTLNVNDVGANFNPTLYYYKDGNGEFNRAFSDIAVVGGKNTVTKLYPDGETLYYRNITALPFDELQNAIVDRINKVQVKEFLGLFSTSTNQGVLEKVIGDSTFEELLSLSIDDIYINDVMDNNSNPKLIALLKDITGKTNTGDDLITLGDVAAFDGGGISLSSLITYESNTSLYDLLYDAITLRQKGTNTTVKVADKTTSTWYEKIKLGHLMGYSFNLDATTGDWLVAEASDAEYTSYFNLDNIVLASVISSPNATLKNVLEDATSKSYQNITLSDIASSSFNFNNVKISNVLTLPSEMLTKILTQATDSSSFASITLGSLTGDNFDITRVRIGTVLGTYTGDNKIISTLITKDTDSDPITLSNLGDKINLISLTEVYSCFEDYNEAKPGIRFTKVGDNYKRDDSGAYQLIDGMGIMLLAMYDYDDATGEYSVKTGENQLTVGNLGEKAGVIKDAFFNAKLKQLKEIGIIDADVNASFDEFTISQILEFLDNVNI